MLRRIHRAVRRSQPILDGQAKKTPALLISFATLAGPARPVLNPRDQQEPLDALIISAGTNAVELNQLPVEVGGYLLETSIFLAVVGLGSSPSANVLCGGRRYRGFPGPFLTGPPLLASSLLPAARKNVKATR